MTLFLEANPNGRTATLHATKVLYATMTGTDVTLYQLKETYGEIQSNYRIDAYLLSDRHPEHNAKIEILSGYWRQGYACNIDTFIPQLKEDQWTFKDSMRYSQPGCETKPGTSGSPVIAAGTHEIIGINNTHNDNGERCTMDNPCEIDAQGNVTVHEGRAYGQQTYVITTCLNNAGQIDLSRQGCLLNKGVMSR